MNLIYLGYQGLGKFIIPIITGVFFTWIMLLLCSKGWMKVAWTISILSMISSIGYFMLLVKNDKSNVSMKKEPNHQN
jgi:hypothetical protein